MHCTGCKGVPKNFIEVFNDSEEIKNSSLNSEKISNKNCNEENNNESKITNNKKNDLDDNLNNSESINEDNFQDKIFFDIHISISMIRHKV